MKRRLLAFLAVCLTASIAACGVEVTYTIAPHGYGLLTDELVGNASYVGSSDDPWTPFQIMIETFMLPAAWGVVVQTDGSAPNEEDAEILAFDPAGTGATHYAKHIGFDGVILTATVVDGNVRYLDPDGVDILVLMLDEAVCERYVLACTNGTIRFVMADGSALVGYRSTLDPTNAGMGFQRTADVKVVNILWLPEANTAFPVLSAHFPEYPAEAVDLLFERAYSHSEEARYRTAVKTSDNPKA